MFAVVYRFETKPGRESEFEQAWAAVTELILEHCGSYGSRLHRIEDGRYYAYARWPSRAAWEASALPAACDPARERMRDCLVNSETLLTGDVGTDLLREP